MILEPRKIKSATGSTSICHEVNWTSSDLWDSSSGFIFFFHTAHGVLAARILQWFASSSEPRSARTLDYDSSVLGGPARIGS